MDTSRDKNHFLDLTLPLGGLLLFYGVVLVFYGRWAGPELYERSLGINMNIWWGVLLLVIGGLMLARWFVTRKRNRTG